MTLDFLGESEQIALSLQDMYSKFGFSKYKMNRFEEYSFYMEQEEFLSDSRLLTFSGKQGKLMALKPDITISVVKNSLKKNQEAQKIYYLESVFRIPKGGEEFKEIRQTGVEYIGNLDNYQTTEILFLAATSLEKISKHYRLCLSNTALLLLFMEELGLKRREKEEIIGFLRQKNIHDLNRYLEEKSLVTNGIFSKLLSLPTDLEEGLKQLEELFSAPVYQAELEQFKTTVKNLASVVDSTCLCLDFSHIPSIDYYEGLVFAGFLEGLALPALTGGRYDKLLEKMGRKGQSSLGFAVDLSATDSLFQSKNVEISYQSYRDGQSVTNLILTAKKLFDEGKTFCFSQE